MDTSIVSAAIAGVSAIVICIINNYVTVRKVQNESYDKIREQLAIARNTSEEHIAELRKDINGTLTEMSAKMEEIIANQELYQAGITKDIEMISYCMKNLETKVEKHNNVVERTYALEKNTEVLNEKVRVANARISDLERENEKR